MLHPYLSASSKLCSLRWVMMSCFFLSFWCLNVLFLNCYFIAFSIYCLGVAANWLKLLHLQKYWLICCVFDNKISLNVKDDVTLPSNSYTAATFSNFQLWNIKSQVFIRQTTKRWQQDKKKDNRGRSVFIGCSSKTESNSE